MNLTLTLEKLLAQKNNSIKNYIKQSSSNRIQEILQTNRVNELSKFNEAIRARTDGKQEDLFKMINFKTILDVFPIWLVNLQGIYNALPLEKELFDLVIIDEGTQCDITSCMPILYRAKRAVIVGDPNQLRHVSFLSRYRQHLAASEYGLPENIVEWLDYRNKSVLDLASGSMKGRQSVFFLDEHFRSLPEIISFSNKEFYNNSLKVMTEKPANMNTGAIEIISCKGKRSKRGVNSIEADRIIKKIQEIIFFERDLDKSMSQTIGVLSPFRNQVDFIYKKLMKVLSIDVLEKHNILVGTAYTFQGEERDIMLLSLTLDDKSHSNTHYFISKLDILNVSITRARVKQFIYLSIDPANLNAKTLVRQYLDFVLFEKTSVPGIKKENSTDLHDDFFNDLMAQLEEYDLRLFPAYEIAGLKIDLVLEYNNKTFGIDLIGCPGEFVDSFSLDRYKMYHRAGLKILPLEYSAWCFDKEACLSALKKAIGNGKERTIIKGSGRTQEQVDKIISEGHKKIHDIFRASEKIKDYEVALVVRQICISARKI